jgi:hypothetical protein
MVNKIYKSSQSPISMMQHRGSAWLSEKAKLVSAEGLMNMNLI